MFFASMLIAVDQQHSLYNFDFSTKTWEKVVRV